MFKILAKRCLAPETYLFEVDAPLVAKARRPGQFIMVLVDGENGERIPLSLCGGNKEDGTIHFIVQAVGRTSKELTSLNVGNSIFAILGPLGTPAHIEKFDSTCVLMGGGYGTGAIIPICDELKKIGNRVIGVVGARNKDLLIMVDELKAVCDEVIITTNDGSVGMKGMVTDALHSIMEEEKVDFVHAIGPVPMMKAVSEMTRPHKIKTMVSINAIMVDATGLCAACRVNVDGKARFACFEGPDFDGHKVDFDELAIRQKWYVPQEKIAAEMYIASKFSLPPTCKDIPKVREQEVDIASKTSIPTACNEPKIHEQELDIASKTSIPTACNEPKIHEQELDNTSKTSIPTTCNEPKVRERSADCGMGNAEGETRSEKFEMRNADCGVRSVERRLQNTEDGLQRTECGVQGSERRLPYHYTPPVIPDGMKPGETLSIQNKDRMKIPRQPMPQQPGNVRINNFDEVTQGFSEEHALLDAARCLQCKDPKCIGNCPVHIDIPAFIKFIERRDFRAAAEKILESNNLPAICGRVCPQEEQCELVCTTGKSKNGTPVSIGRLERFVADWALRNNVVTGDKRATPTGFRVAVVGSGPAGLTCAADLAKMGHDVTVFEALHKVGGVLIYGIPTFRLPPVVVDKEVDNLRKMGVKFVTNCLVGRTHTVDALLKEESFDAVFIGTGAGLPHMLGCPGENLKGVYTANEFLTRINLMRADLFPGHITPVTVGKNVVVIGCGNTAMDAARVSLRLGQRAKSEERRAMGKEQMAKGEGQRARVEGQRANPVRDTTIGNSNIFSRAGFRLQEISNGAKSEEQRARVAIVYRRDEDSSPAREEELEHAKEEGVEFLWFTQPLKFSGNADGWVAKMTCSRTEYYGEPDPNDAMKRRPVRTVPNSEFELEVDTVISAMGFGVNPLIASTTPDIKVNKRGVIIADSATGATTKEGVFAGGDAITGGATVILAMGQGKTAASAIDKYLREKKTKALEVSGVMR